MGIELYVCPTCGAKNDEPCRTPKGRKKEAIHDTRPFGLTMDAETTQKIAQLPK